MEGFENTNCNKVFSAALKDFGYSAVGLRQLAEGESTLFYNVRDPAYANVTQNQVVGNTVRTTLGHSLPYGQSAATINGSLGAAVLLAGDWSNQADAGDTLVHEMLHSLGKGKLGDPVLFDRFASHGLSNSGFGSKDITDWIGRDCKAK